MKRVLCLNVLILSFFISCNHKEKETSCYSNFSMLGVKDEKLGINIYDLKKKITPLNLKKGENDIGNFHSFTYSDSIIYNGERIKTDYYFTFLNDSLVSYHFDFIGNQELFEDMVNKLYEKKNQLIKSNKNKQLSYFIDKEECKSFFYLIYRADEKLHISGGIENNKLPKL
ncbi:hypothetical protein OIU80_11705 [Flavobacterium sp. LS1R47]|uniref:Lipoprotein n=1 Tax=Flavobacterium frigoritolerans TaxID=2987686 RepID=A0A9X2ZQJ8_9FLAO|nr:hypothetical protein [Flavobacterium frigoritolerans]MCV9932946.1 hypothetical protein [Flavobacterium frigoritolerans]